MVVNIITVAVNSKTIVVITVTKGHIICVCRKLQDRDREKKSAFQQTNVMKENGQLGLDGPIVQQKQFTILFLPQLSLSN